MWNEIEVLHKILYLSDSLHMLKLYCWHIKFERSMIMIQYCLLVAESFRTSKIFYQDVRSIMWFLVHISTAKQPLSSGTSSWMSYWLEFGLISYSVCGDWTLTFQPTKSDLINISRRAVLCLIWNSFPFTYACTYLMVFS